MALNRQKFFFAAQYFALAAVPIALLVGLIFEFQNKTLFLFSVVFISFVPFVFSFERMMPSADEIMPVAVIAAAGAVGRILFAAVPNFKPVTAIVIIAGVTLGSSNGFICGALSALASNIFFGQGAWTLWQMYAWGLIGFLSGVLSSRGLLKRLPSVCAWGAFSCLVYGVLLDSWHIIGYISPLSVKTAAATYAAGVPFSLVHAVSTVIFLLILYVPWCKIINRIKLKYFDE